MGDEADGNGDEDGESGFVVVVVRLGVLAVGRERRVDDMIVGRGDNHVRSRGWWHMSGGASIVLQNFKDI